MPDLVGTWRLVEWTFSVDDQKQRKPFGGDPVGLLTYTEDGHMSATLMRRERPQPDTTTLSAAPAGERAQIAAGYVAYAGPYRREGDTVIHQVEVSLFPNWVGGEQVRTITWIENENGGYDLELATPPEPTEGGRKAVNRLRWRRTDNGDAR